MGSILERSKVAVLLALVALPILLPAMPPLVDLPGHMGRYHVAAFLDQSAQLEKYYAYSWYVIGNLGVDLLTFPLSPFLGTEGATRLVTSAIPVLTGLGIILIARTQEKAITPAMLLALIFCYSYPYHFGFVNYCLSIAFAFMGFALWLHWGERMYLRQRAIAFALIAPLVWLTHAVGWAVLAVICGANELYRRYQAGETFGQILRGTILACLPIVMPVLATMLAFPGAGASAPWGWFDTNQLARWFVSLLRDKWIAFDIATLLVLLGSVGAAASGWRHLALRPALLWPAIALFVLYIVAPDGIGLTSNVSGRIILPAAVMAVLAIDSSRCAPHIRRRLAQAAFGLFALRMLATTVSFFQYDSDIRRQLEALDNVRDGSAVAILVRLPCKKGLAEWSDPRTSHLGGYALTRRHAYVNDQWFDADVQLIQSRYRQAGYFTSNPSQFATARACPRGMNNRLTLDAALARLPQDAFSYLWLIEFPAKERPRRPWLHEVHRDGRSALYEIRRDAGSVQAAQADARPLPAGKPEAASGSTL